MMMGAVSAGIDTPENEHRLFWKKACAHAVRTGSPGSQAVPLSPGYRSPFGAMLVL